MSIALLKILIRISSDERSVVALTLANPWKVSSNCDVNVVGRLNKGLFFKLSAILGISAMKFENVGMKVFEIATISQMTNARKVNNVMAAAMLRGSFFVTSLSTIPFSKIVKSKEQNITIAKGWTNQNIENSIVKLSVIKIDV